MTSSGRTYRAREKTHNGNKISVGRSIALECFEIRIRGSDPRDVIEANLQGCRAHLRISRNLPTHFFLFDQCLAKRAERPRYFSSNLEIYDGCCPRVIAGAEREENSLGANPKVARASST